jgi:hypothetical protein
LKQQRRFLLDVLHVMGKRELWLLLGVFHYNMKNYKSGSITEMIDGFKKIKWQRKEEVEKIFG